jgi:HEAT repeat protein
MFARYLFVRTLAFCLLAAAPAVLPAQQPPPSEGDEARQIEILQSDAPLFDKAKACQMLAVIGGQDCIPVLAELLADPQLAHYARFGLEPNPDPAVDQALRASLDDLDGLLLVGVINTIGMRRDQQAMDALKELTTHSDQQVAAAAMAALGRLATPEAIEVLLAAIAGQPAMQSAAADASLSAGDMLLAQEAAAQAIELYDTLVEAELAPRYTIAALHGAIRARGSDGLPMVVELLTDEDPARFAVALGMSHELGGPQVAEALIDALGDLPTQRRKLIVYVLGDLGEPAALPVVLELAGGATSDVRLPAVEVLAQLGDADAVGVLLDAATADDETLSAAARTSLADLPGDDVDARLGELIASSSGAQRLVLIELAGLRRITSALPTLMQLADDQDEGVRTAALRALGLTIGLEQLPSLIDRLVAPTTAEAATTAKEALNTALLRMPDRDAAAQLLIQRMPDASMAAKVDLLSLLGVLGGDRALEGVAAAARAPEDEVQDAATRVLGEWITADAAPVLLALAKTGPDRYKVRTLRGYIRIARQLDVPLDERIEMCRRTIEAAGRPDEVRLALEVLGRYPTLAGLQIAAEQLKRPAVQQAAAAAAVTIAEKIVGAQPAAVAAVMEKAAAVATDAEVAQKAKNLLRRAQR